MLIAVTHMHDMGTTWWVLMIVGGAVVWGLVIWAVIALVRGAGTPAPARDLTPRETLDRRLAEGEIPVEEYERARDTLSR